MTTDTLDAIGEFGLIHRIARLLPTAPSVVEGIGDDCAVLRVGDRLLLVSSDLSVEGVHFRKRYGSPEDIGWKAAASSLSDIAAMGGAPLFGLVSLACPGNRDVAFIEGVYDGLIDAMSQCGAVIVGGDTTRAQEHMTLDVTVLGETIGNRYLARRGALPGDALAVTGHLGLSGAGLRALTRNDAAPALVHAHYHPTPRISEGQWLSNRPEVHAMIDISDGLIQDVGHLAETARLGADIHAANLPVEPSLAQYCAKFGFDPAEFMLSGGEDYELAFAVDGAHAEDIVQAFRREFQVPIHIVGEFTEAWQSVRVDGQVPTRTGFDHFK